MIFIYYVIIKFGSVFRFLFIFVANHAEKLNRIFIIMIEFVSFYLWNLLTVFKCASQNCMAHFHWKYPLVYYLNLLQMERLAQNVPSHKIHKNIHRSKMSCASVLPQKPENQNLNAKIRQSHHHLNIYLCIKIHRILTLQQSISTFGKTTRWKDLKNFSKEFFLVYFAIWVPLKQNMYSKCSIFCAHDINISIENTFLYSIQSHTVHRKKRQKRKERKEVQNAATKKSLSGFQAIFFPLFYCCFLWHIFNTTSREPFLFENG